MSQAEANLKAMSKTRRSVKNYALQPLLQVKLGFYSVFFSVIFATVVGVILYFHLGKIMSIVFTLTGVEDEVRNLLDQYIAPARIQLVILMTVYVIITLILSIIYTHKLVGPTVAFRRHIRMIADEKWDYRTKLREGDAFNEVAEDLNLLSSYLGKKYGNPKE